MADNITILKPIKQARRASASLFVVRWQDDDRGWQSVLVDADSEDSARALVLGLVGRGDQVYRAA